MMIERELYDFEKQLIINFYNLLWCGFSTKNKCNKLPDGARLGCYMVSNGSNTSHPTL